MKFLNSFKSIFLNGIFLLITLAQTILITKFISQLEYGSYGFLISLSQFIFVFGSWGFSSWGVNIITKDLNNQDKYFQLIVKSRFFTSFIAILLLIIYTYKVNFQLNSVLFTSFIIYAINIAISPEILFISKGKIEIFIKIGILNKFIHTILLLLLFYNFNITSNYIFLIFSIFNLLNNLVSNFYLKTNFNEIFRFKMFSLDFLKKSSENFVLNLIPFFFASGSLIYSGILLSKTNFSIIYSSFAIIKLLQAAYNPMVQKVLPILNIQNSKLAILKNIKTHIFYCLIYSTLCCFFLKSSSTLISNIIFSTKYNGIDAAINLYSIAIIPGLISTILISQICVFLNLIKFANLALFITSSLIFVTLYLLSNSLDWRKVIYINIIFEIILVFIIAIIIYFKFKYEKYF